jgi:hypothetical protein
MPQPNRDAESLHRRKWKLDTDARWWRRDVHTEFVVAALKYQKTGTWTPATEKAFNAYKASPKIVMRLVVGVGDAALELCTRVPERKLDGTDNAVVWLKDNIDTMLQHLRWLCAAVDVLHVEAFHKHVEGTSTNEAVDEMMKQHFWGYEPSTDYERLRNAVRAQTESFKETRRKSDAKRATERNAEARETRAALKQKAETGDAEAASALEELRQADRERRQRSREATAEADKIPDLIDHQITSLLDTIH